VTVDTYFWEMVPTQCTPIYPQPLVDIYIYQNGVNLENKYYMDYLNEPMLIAEADYEAGDTWTFEIDYWWFSGRTPRDYTVKVYSSQDLEVKDKKGNTNMLHNDGQEPSGFSGLF